MTAQELFDYINIQLANVKTDRMTHQFIVRILTEAQTKISIDNKSGE